MNILNKINNFSLYMYNEGFSDDLNGQMTLISFPAAVATWLLSPFSWPIIVAFHYAYKATMMGFCFYAHKRGKKLYALRDKMSTTLYRLDLYKEVE